MEGFKDFFLHLGGTWGYVFLFLSSMAENLFPPMPGDTFVVLGSFLVGRGQLALIPAYLATMAGSMAGFMILFFVGRKLGRSFFANKHGRFFSEHHLQQVEDWFARYGYWVIGFNRFLSGIRAVVSLAAGMASMDVRRVMVMAFISCLIWNAGLMALGIWVGDNWQIVLAYYQRIILAIIVLFGVGLYLRKRLAGSLKRS